MAAPIQRGKIADIAAKWHSPLTPLLMPDVILSSNPSEGGEPLLWKCKQSK